MPDLPSVTLSAVDCINPLLALRALDLCGRQCRFGEVMFLSDSANQYQMAGCRMEVIPRIGSRAEYSRFVLKELGAYLRTDYLLLIQWDGYIINPESWRPEFLEYDYIGAPWGWYQDAHRIGNGGFSLRSRRLFDALLDEEIADPDPEDEAMGRRYRTLLESKYGIRFAPEEIAAAFSFETTYPPSRTFCFHGLFNMWMVLPQQELAEFVSVLAPSTVAGIQFLQLGKNYLELGRKEEAALVLKRRLEVAPGDAEAAKLLSSVTSPGIVSSAPANRSFGRNDPPVRQRQTLQAMLRGYCQRTSGGARRIPRGSVAKRHGTSSFLQQSRSVPASAGEIKGSAGLLPSGHCDQAGLCPGVQQPWTGFASLRASG